jgi:hypothetical protein
VLHHDPTFIIFFVIGWISGAANSSILLTSLVGLVLRRFRRRMAAAATVLAQVAALGAIGCMFAYAWEAVAAYNSTNPYEKFTFFHAHFFCYYAYFYCGGIIGSYIIPQLFWIRRCRTNLWWLFSISLICALSMCSERLFIIFTSVTGMW